MSQVLKLEQIFAEFMQNRAPFSGPIVVGVSGGADSLGLIFAAQAWAKQTGHELWAVTIDHDLRSKSAIEAEKVGRLLAQHKIQHKILKWTGAKPETRIQELARQARYELLVEFVKSIGGNHLLVAHHAGDQQETFMMRLMAGSGSDGLACMKDSREFKGCQILRPFLRVYPEIIRYYLESKGISWIEDPSNKNERFQRVRIRKFLETEGLSLDRIQSMIDKFSQDRDFFEETRDNWIRENSTGIPGIYLHIKSLEELTRLHKAISRRVLTHLLQTMHPTKYAIRTAKVDDLLNSLLSMSFKGATLGGCQLIKRKGGLHIQREFAKIDHKIILPSNGSLWDNRIIIDDSFGAIGFVEKLGHEAVPALKEHISPAISESIPSIVWPTLPAVKVDDKILVIPHLRVNAIQEN